MKNVLLVFFNPFDMLKVFNTSRNFNNVQFADLREQIDDQFNDLHDQLSDCYYNYWQDGKSKPFISGGKSYDVQATPDESRVLFDKLHGLIFMHQEVRFHEENLKQPAENRIPEEKYNNILDETGQVVGKKNTETIEQINQLKKEGLELTI